VGNRLSLQFQPAERALDLELVEQWQALPTGALPVRVWIGGAERKPHLRVQGGVGLVARIARVVDLGDQVEATRRIFATDTRWTVVRGSELEEGDSQGVPVLSRHVGDPILRSNLTRRTDFALFMVEALENDELIHEAPAIVGRETPSALAHAVPC
jgi:hypothetical protein